MRKKNRKLRWMRQLYPEVRVKLFYARDFRALMVKYGRLSFLSEIVAANRAPNGARTTPPKDGGVTQGAA